MYKPPAMAEKMATLLAAITPNPLPDKKLLT